MTSRPPALFVRTRVARVSISADAYDHAMDSLVLLGGAHQPVPMTAQAIAEGAEYRALANYHSRSKRNGPLVFCESHAGKAVGANGSGRGRPIAATLRVSARSGSPLS
jgi:hypothetical protein